MSETPQEGESAADTVTELRLRAEALERQLAEVQRKAEARLIHSELKAEAIKAGIIDTDGLRLVDLGAVKLNEAGEVENAGALVARLRQAKPWLFGAPPATSSSGTASPPVQPPRQKSAMEMSESEWHAARENLLKSRS